MKLAGGSPQEAYVAEPRIRARYPSPTKTQRLSLNLESTSDLDILPADLPCMLDTGIFLSLSFSRQGVISFIPYFLMFIDQNSPVPICTINLNRGEEVTATFWSNLQSGVKTPNFTQSAEDFLAPRLPSANTFGKRSSSTRPGLIQEYHFFWMENKGTSI